MLVLFELNEIMFYKRNDLEKCKLLLCYLYWIFLGELSFLVIVILIGAENRRVWVEWGREYVSVFIKIFFVE